MGANRWDGGKDAANCVAANARKTRCRTRRKNCPRRNARCKNGARKGNIPKIGVRKAKVGMLKGGSCRKATLKIKVSDAVLLLSEVKETPARIFSLFIRV
ncbi:MAG: hypothetical protein DBX55_07525 [Verrucomicrobia bacterium]|nr:MAG: hypothetical protein DBX55_07525 [Verrucomicrobiota bacterium]